MSARVVITSLALSVAAIVTTYLYRKSRNTNKLPSEWKTVGKIKSLCIYPLKSGRRLEVQSAECTKEGLMELPDGDKLRLRDRSFVAYNGNNFEYRNARHYPKMVLISLESVSTDTVKLTAPNMEPLLLQIPDKKVMRAVTLIHYRNEKITSTDCGDEVATWLSQYLLNQNSGLRLAYHDGTFRRAIKELYKDVDDFYKRGLRDESAGLNSDLVAVMLVNQHSVNDISEKIGDEINAFNFRPNFVVDDPALKPFDEDNWRWIKIGNVIIKNVADCARCTMTTVDIDTGERRTDGEPLKILKKLRTNNTPQGGPIMGVYGEVFITGIVSVGDTVYVEKYN